MWLVQTLNIGTASAVEVRFQLTNSWLSSRDAGYIRNHLKQSKSPLLTTRDEIVLHESKFRDPRSNLKRATENFETEMNRVIAAEMNSEVIKAKRKKENNNPAKLRKANEKRLKDKRMKQYTKMMRNKFD